MKISGQRALVTGAGRGIGAAIAVRLAESGAHVVLVARSQEQLEATAEQCRSHGVEAHTHVADLTDADACEQLAAQLQERYDAIDILVNNAGAFITGNAQEGNPSSWQKLLQINMLAPMLLTRTLSPGMIERERGMIINIGSVSAIDSMKGGGAYAASKHGLRGWTRSCYEQLRNHGIKVVLINPGFVNTALVDARPGLDLSKMILPEDVAEAAMLAVRTSPMCCPTEIDLRLTKTCYVN